MQKHQKKRNKAKIIKQQLKKTKKWKKQKDPGVHSCFRKQKIAKNMTNGPIFPGLDQGPAQGLTLAQPRAWPGPAQGLTRASKAS